MKRNWSIVASPAGDPSRKRQLAELLRSEGFTVRDACEWMRTGVRYLEDNPLGRVSAFHQNHCFVWKDPDFDARLARCRARWEELGWHDDCTFKDYRELSAPDKQAVDELLAKGKPDGGGRGTAGEASAMNDLMRLSHIDDTLRPYQADAKKRIAEAWLSHRSVMYQMPTGTGKTRLFVSLIADISRRQPGARVLIVTHREELVQQVSDSLSLHYGLEHGIVQGRNTRDTDRAVVVASVQSLCDFQFSKDPQFIIIDEAHHSLAPTYAALWERHPHAKVLGVTATPYRLKRASFKGLFDLLIESQPMREFIAGGYLADYRYFTVSARRSALQRINRLTQMGADGDYRKKDLDAICNSEEEVAFVYQCYARHAPGRKGIVYAVNRAHAELIADAFKAHGVAAANIDSTTRTKERTAMTERFRRGELQVLVNVELFAEGFDCPSIEFVLLARPTRSLALYLQQVGRALRPNPLFNGRGGKALIIDCVGLHARFGLPDRRRDWQLHFAGGKSPRENYTKPLGSDTWLRMDGMEEVTRTVYRSLVPMEADWLLATDEGGRQYIVDREQNLLAPYVVESLAKEASGNYTATLTDRSRLPAGRLCDLHFTPGLQLVAEGEEEIGGCRLYVVKERTRRLYATRLSLDAPLYKAPKAWGRWLRPDRNSLTRAGLYPQLIETDSLPEETAVPCPEEYLTDGRTLYAKDGTTYRRMPGGYQLYYRQTEQAATLYDGTLREIWHGTRIIALEDHALLFASEAEPPRHFGYYDWLFGNSPVVQFSGDEGTR